MSEALRPYRLFTEADRDRYTQSRPGERRVGQTMPILDKWDGARDHAGLKVVILGIPESIGPQANLGRDGAQRGWEAFLARFLNMQSNPYLKGPSVAIAGMVETEDLQQQIDPQDTDETRFNAWREVVGKLDVRVRQAIHDLRLPKRITLVVIGGGHNNAYPIMKALGPGATVVNVDPHADFRAREGRHSGNPFRYAMEEEVLHTYIPVGLHKAYNNAESILAMETNPRVFPAWWDDVAEVSELMDWASEHVGSSQGKYVGLEMDMDSIAQMPTSAFTPEGLSPSQARWWIRQWATHHPETRYVHLPEAAPANAHEAAFAGKLLAYLVSDWVIATTAHT